MTMILCLWIWRRFLNPHTLESSAVNQRCLTLSPIIHLPTFSVCSLSSKMRKFGHFIEVSEDLVKGFERITSQFNAGKIKKSGRGKQQLNPRG